jgi:preprotein translocase subunit SecF
MNIVNKRLWYFAIAIVVALICIVSLATIGIKSGVEFSSGSILSITFDKPVSQDALSQEMNTLGYKSALIQSAGTTGRDYIIRINTANLDDTSKNQITNSLGSSLGTLKVNEFDNVSPMIASETTRNAGIAVIVAVVLMLLYIAFAFRKMPSPFKFGVGAIVGLAFDLLVALGVFSILGAIWGWQIDLMFIAGILAILGYSINNTVIVYDRMRENMARGISHDIAEIANASIVQTLGRSFNTSITTLFTLFVLAVFVGSTIQNFVMVLIIGVISGTFTSTFISPELVVSWEKGQWSGKKSDGLVAAKAKT